MKFILAVAALVASATAQDISSLPACGQGCISRMVAIASSQFGCAAGDASCYCRNEAFGLGLRDCSGQACGADVQAQVVSYGNVYCSSAAAAATVSSGASSVAASASSAASGAIASISSSASSAAASASASASSAVSSLNSSAASAASGASSSASSKASSAAAGASSSTSGSGAMKTGVPMAGALAAAALFIL